MLVAVEIDESSDEIPDRAVVGVEDVRTVYMDFDAGFRVGFATNVAADGAAFFKHQHFSARFGEPSCDGASPDARTRDYAVYLFHVQEYIKNVV